MIFFPKISLGTAFVLLYFLHEIFAHSSYTEYHIEDDDLCSFIRKRKIKIHNQGPHSGLLVQQSRLNDHSIPWKVDFYCKFVVDAPSKTGIIVVIQRLNFRQNKTTGQCIDFVQFHARDGSRSQQFCGKISAFTADRPRPLTVVESVPESTELDALYPEEDEFKILVDNSFVDEKGQMDVVIHVSKEPLRKDERNDLFLAFTAYRKCTTISEVLHYGGSETNYKSCTEGMEQFCIWSGFFNDNIINCPFYDCLDESGKCYKWDPKQNIESNSDKILLGALTSICLIFGLFILCMWISKTFKLFCWAPCFANPSRTPSQQESPQPRVIELHEASATAAESPTSGAPPSAPPDDENKDLPPSYDSLFPSR